MSKIKNGGLDQYGAEPSEQQQFGTVGIEGVNCYFYLYSQNTFFTVMYTCLFTKILCKHFTLRNTVCSINDQRE